jgi:hypothetical protein
VRFDAFNERAHGGGFMRRQVVHDDDVAWGQRRQNERVDTGDEGFAVHRPVEHQWRDHAGQPQRGDAGRHLPVSVRSIVDEPFAAWGTPACPCHVGRGPGLVDEDEFRGIDRGLLVFQTSRAAATSDLACSVAHSVFCNVMPRRAKNRTNSDYVRRLSSRGATPLTRLISRER